MKWAGQPGEEHHAYVHRDWATMIHTRERERERDRQRDRERERDRERQGLEKSKNLNS